MNRRHPRAVFRTEIWLGQDGIFTRSTEMLRDLSERGAFVQTRQPFSKGSILSLRFQMPYSGRVATTTVIVRHATDAVGMGVEFLDLSSGDRSELRSFIHDQLLRVA